MLACIFGDLVAARDECDFKAGVRLYLLKCAALPTVFHGITPNQAKPDYSKICFTPPDTDTCVKVGSGVTVGVICYWIISEVPRVVFPLVISYRFPERCLD